MKFRVEKISPGPGILTGAAPVTLTLISCLLFIGVYLFATPATAQQSNESSAVEASKIQQRIQQIRPDVRAEKQDVIGPSAPDAAAPAMPTQEFVLSAVIIEGNTVFTAEDFSPLYQDLLASKVTQAQMQTLAQEITRIYREKGYVLSKAVIPEQTIRSGVLKISIIEGYIQTVDFIGPRSDETRLQGYTSQLGSERPVQITTLERALMLINSLPGLTIADSTLLEGDGAGAYVLTVELENQAADFVVYADNRGTPEAGRLETWLSAGFNSPLGLSERFQLGLFTIPENPEELIYLEGRYHQPVGDQGTELRVALSYSTLDLDGNLAASNTESSSRRAVIDIRHPLLLTRSESLWLQAELDLYDLDEDQFGVKSFEDRTRVLRFSAEYWRPQIWNGSLYITGMYSHGLDIFGASGANRAKLSRADGRAEFDKIEAEISRDQELFGPVSAALNAKVQMSSAPLLSADEFYVGGSQYGRGYDFGELSGDDGLATSIELRYDNNPANIYLEHIQLYGFYDWGTAKSDNVTGAAHYISLASAGVGARLTMFANIYADLTAAKPLTLTPNREGDRDARAFFSVSTQF